MVIIKYGKGLFRFLTWKLSCFYICFYNLNLKKWDLKKAQKFFSLKNFVLDLEFWLLQKILRNIRLNVNFYLLQLVLKRLDLNFTRFCNLKSSTSRNLALFLD